MPFFFALKSMVSKDRLIRCLLICFFPAMAFYAISLVLLSLGGFDLLQILRDPAQQTKASSFLGFLSSIGSWLWLSAAVICFFRVATFEASNRADIRLLLKMIGWFSFVLAVDDFFLIHDRYITEGILIPLYAMFVIYLLVKQRSTLNEIDGTAFLLAGTCLLMSVLVDAVQEILPMRYDHTQVIEEGFKFLGAATWLYFCFRVAAFSLICRGADQPGQ